MALTPDCMHWVFLLVYLTSLWRHERYLFSVFRGILPAISGRFSKKLSTSAVVHQKNIFIWTFSRRFSRNLTPRETPQKLCFIYFNNLVKYFSLATTPGIHQNCPSPKTFHKWIRNSKYFYFFLASFVLCGKGGERGRGKIESNLHICNITIKTIFILETLLFPFDIHFNMTYIYSPHNLQMFETCLNIL
jgi:hypothetical protein